MPDPSADADLWSSGHRLTVLGWGYLNPSNTVYSAELRRAEEKVADNAITLPPLRGMMKMNYVAGYATHGDSGAPLIGKNSPGRLHANRHFRGVDWSRASVFQSIWPQAKLIDFINSQQYVSTSTLSVGGK
jgi:hypothetical protein